MQFTLNTNLHSSTGYTPYELVYGRPHTVPPDLARFVPPADHERTTDFAYGVHVGAISEDEQAARDREALLRVRDFLFRVEGPAYVATARAKHRSMMRSHRAWLATKRSGGPVQPGCAVLILRPPPLAGKRAEISGPYLFESTDPRTGMAVIRSGTTRGVTPKTWLERPDGLVRYDFPPTGP